MGKRILFEFFKRPDVFDAIVARLSNAHTLRVIEAVKSQYSVGNDFTFTDASDIMRKLGENDESLGSLATHLNTGKRVKPKDLCALGDQFQEALTDTLTVAGDTFQFREPIREADVVAVDAESSLLQMLYNSSSITTRLHDIYLADGRCKDIATRISKDYKNKLAQRDDVQS